MLNLGRKRRIVAVVGRDEQSRSALVDAGAWQRSFSCSVRVILVTDAGIPSSSPGEADRFCRWAGQKAQLDLGSDNVVACRAPDIVAHFEDATTPYTDLVVCPGSVDLSTAMGTVAIHALWSQAAPLGASLLLSRRKASAMRRVLVVTDGTPRTLPVLQMAFELADHFDVQLSHLDSLRVPSMGTPSGPGLDELMRLRGTKATDSAQKYLQVVHGLVETVNRAQHDVRPDLLLMGASVDDGGGVASALSSASLPCSVLIVPL